VTQGGIEADGVTTRIIPMRGSPRDITPWSGEGGHGGGDDVMLDEIFGSVSDADKYRRASDERSGAYSALVGAAANASFQSGQSVRIADMVTGLTPPEMAPMPTRTAPVPMPMRVPLPR
jgi:hypothetical protein